MKGRLLPDNKFLVEHRVMSHEVDFNKRTTPAAFMNWAQELAYLAADALDFGYDRLQEKGYAWVLSRFHIRFPDPPVWREDVDLMTWHKGMRGPFFVRDFTVRDKAGNDKILATSSWLVLNMKTRGVVFISDQEEFVDSSSNAPGSAIEQPAGKVAIPRGAESEPAGEHRVRYTDLDFIGHTNNVRYVSWALDCLDPEYLMTHPLNDIQIAFNHEVHANETVSLLRFTDENVIWVEGRKTDGSQAFCVRMEF